MIYVTKVRNSKKQYVFRWLYLFNCTVILSPEFAPLNLILMAFSHPISNQGRGSVFSLPETRENVQENLHFTNSASRVPVAQREILKIINFNISCKIHQNVRMPENADNA